MGLVTILRIGGVLVFAISTLFVFMALSISSDNTDMEVAGGIEGAVPAAPGSRGPKRHRRSPAPVIKPVGRPSMLDWLGDEYNLRQCQCRKDWKSVEQGTPICKCNRLCPPDITPAFLTEAKGQALCSLEEHQGFNCYADCPEGAKDGKDVKWYATPCGGANQPTCDPSILKYRRDAKVETARRAEEEKKKAEVQEKEKSFPKVSWDTKEVFDLRGLTCELKDGKEQCFMEDEQGRELCPPHVDHQYLGFPTDQFLCSEAMVDKYYCTVTCSSDGNEVRWGAHEISWCFDPKNIGACPPRPTPIPKAEFQLKPWSEIPEKELECARRWREGERPSGPVKGLTIGLLTHEANAFAVSMATYEENGLFDSVTEFLVFMNRRRPEVEAVAEKYRKKYPDTIRLMGDSQNYGILRPMVWLTGNASNPYFMFLERDFMLIEPATCVVEQFQTGLDLIKAGTAHVVRYRHRKHPGRPNWAARMFRGHEDDVFKNGQPNLFCNHYYWVDQPEKRWPDKIWLCNQQDQPEMFCSDSFYCNWTNNPQIWDIGWWNKEYVAAFDHFQRNDPWYDVEVYMNWEPNSWNDRKWIVAQGDGLFKHSDRAKWG